MKNTGLKRQTEMLQKHVGKRLDMQNPYIRRAWRELLAERDNHNLSSDTTRGLKSKQALEALVECAVAIVKRNSLKLQLFEAAKESVQKNRQFNGAVEAWEDVSHEASWSVQPLLPVLFFEEKEEEEKKHNLKVFFKVFQECRAILAGAKNSFSKQLTNMLPPNDALRMFMTDFLATREDYRTLYQNVEIDPQYRKMVSQADEMPKPVRVFAMLIDRLKLGAYPMTSREAQ